MCESFLSSHSLDEPCSIFDAINTGSLHTVKTYIQIHGTPYHSSTSRRQTPLHYASRIGHIEIFRELLKYYKNINSFNIFRQTPLHIACMNEKIEIVQELVSLDGIKLNYIDRKTGTPLHYAVQLQDPTITQILLQGGATPHLFDDTFGFKAIHRAIENGRFENFIALLEAGEHIDCVTSLGTPLLQFSATHRQIHIFSYLLEHTPHLEQFLRHQTQSFFQMVHYLAQKNLDLFLELLLKKDPQSLDLFSQEGFTPLHYAIMSKSPKTVQVLLNHGANIYLRSQNTKQHTPFYQACISHCPQTALLIIEKVDMSPFFSTAQPSPLHVVAQNGHPQTVDFLCQHFKKYINQHSPRGFSPLHYACSSQRLRNVEVLIKHGANLHELTSCSKGLSPLHITASTPPSTTCDEDQNKIIQLLIKSGADIEQKSRMRDQTALHYASGNGYTTVVCTLLDYKADINAISKTDRLTPLQCAAINQHSETISLLLQRGVCQTIHNRSSRGWTALHYATKSMNFDIMKMLIQSGALFSLLSIPEQTQVLELSYLSDKELFSLILQQLLPQNPKITNLLRPIVSPAIHHTMQAIEENHIDNLKLCIQWHFFLNTPPEQTTLFIYFAVEKGHLDSLNLLLEYVPQFDINLTDLYHLIFVACKKGNLKIIKRIIQLDPDCLSYQDKNHQTPFLLASQLGFTPIAELLIESQADTSAVDKAMRTALHIACQHNHKKEVLRLLQHSFPVNALDIKKRTPFHYACMEGNLEIAQLLVSYGADINLFATNGFHAIHYASIHGHLDVVQFLLDNNVPVDLPSSNQYPLTSFYLACERGHSTIAETLLKLGSKELNVQKNGISPLHYAARGEYLDVVLTLIRYDVSLNDYSKEGYTALHYAIRNGHFPITQALLSAGADPRLPSKPDNFFPLSYALQYQFHEIATLIWSYLPTSQNSHLDLQPYPPDPAQDIYAPHCPLPSSVYALTPQQHFFYMNPSPYSYAIPTHPSLPPYWPQPHLPVYFDAPCYTPFPPSLTPAFIEQNQQAPFFEPPLFVPPYLNQTIATEPPIPTMQASVDSFIKNASCSQIHLHPIFSST